MNPLIPGLSVVIPVYQSEHILPSLIERLAQVLQATGLAYELILVNDGSRDQSWTIIRAESSKRPWVRGICLMRNYGQHNALLAGIRAARYDTIITMDDDLQHPPEVLPALLSKLAEGFDVVYGSPENGQHGILRNLASVVTRLTLSKAMGAETARMSTSLRVFRTQLRGAFANYQSPYVSIDVLLTWATTKFTALPVRHDSRTFGRSTYTLGMLIRHGIDMLTGFSELPLQIASVAGLGFALFGFAVLAYLLGQSILNGASVGGLPFLVAILAIFSGAQLFALGIVGEYLSRMHFRLMDKPAYFVKETITPEEPSNIP